MVALASLYIITIAAKGFAATFYQDEFPEALAIKMEVLPVIFPVHMFTGALALLLIPATYLVKRRPAHRWLGGLTAATVFVAGVTALPVAWVEPVTPWSGAGFMAQAILWLAFLGLALWNLYKRRLAKHRYYMLLMAATAFGAVFFRIYLAFWALLGDFRYYRTFYSIDSWIGWLTPLALAIFLLRNTSPWRRNAR